MGQAGRKRTVSGSADLVGDPLALINDSSPLHAWNRPFTRILVASSATVTKSELTADC